MLVYELVAGKMDVLFMYTFIAIASNLGAVVLQDDDQQRPRMTVNCIVEDDGRKEEQTKEGLMVEAEQNVSSWSVRVT